MTEGPPDDPRSEGAVDETLPDGVRGDFDVAVVRDYAPISDANDPLLHIDLEAQFEGPLDLLLHIIRRDGLDIFDIQMGRICESYHQALSQMKDLNIDVAAEFLLMAATLVHIKSKMLLPKEERPEDEDEGEEGDPRSDLVRRLLEYQKYRGAAVYLTGMPWVGRDVFSRPPPEVQEQLEAALAPMDAMRLVSVLSAIFVRTERKIVHEIFVERMSVGARINELIDVCRVREHITFDELLAYGDEPVIKGRRVVTFLALLEMTRLKLITVHQPSEKGTIYLTPIHANLDIDAAEINSSFDAPPETGDEAPGGSDHVQ